MENNEVKCKICNREFIGFKQLGNHLKTEKITPKDYYDKFLLKNNSNICYCGNYNNFINLNKGYHKYCSLTCMQNSSEIKEKKEKTCIKNHGAPYYSQTEEFWKNYKQTNLKNIGYENPLQCPKIQQQIRETNNEKYGTPYPMQNSEIQKKKVKTNIKKYGCNSPLQNEKVKEKIRETINEKYGVDHYSKTNEFKFKHKKTMQKNYGVDNYSQTKEFKIKYNKIMNKKYEKDYYFQTEEYQIKNRKTCNEKFGCNSPLQSLEIKKKMIKTKHDIFYNNLLTTDRLQNKVIPLFNINEYKGISRKNKYLWKCNECLTEFNDDLYSGHTPRCKICYPLLNGFSKGEKEVVEFCKIYYPDLIENDRTQISPLELDIYIPELKLAIEYNGLFWHSEENKSKNYHYNKYLLCKEKGIQLIQIFEDEWENKQEIIKNLLLNKFGKLLNEINIEDCIIKEIDSYEAQYFLLNNSVNKSSSSDINISLQYNNEIVSLLSIIKTDYDKYFINIFCNKINYNVVNSFNLLFNYFKDKYSPSNIILKLNSRYENDIYDNNINFEYKYRINPCVYNYNNNYPIWDCGKELYFYENIHKNILSKYKSQNKQFYTTRTNL